MAGGFRGLMEPGIVHSMAYPETVVGKDWFYETIQKVAADEFFSCIEVTHIDDPVMRKKVAHDLRIAGMRVGYGAQPVLLGRKLNLNSTDGEERARAIAAVKSCVDEALELGARFIGILSGPDMPGAREEALILLKQSLVEICEYAGRRGGLTVALEVFDREVDKKRLVGSTADAARLVGDLRRDYPWFGLMIDLSHIPQQRETVEECVRTAGQFTVHVHIGNCVIRDRSHPAYGDQHPRFGVEGGEIGPTEVAEFLDLLRRVGYLRNGTRRPVSFEVKPMVGEDPDLVVAGSKRVLETALAMLE
ncbi:MAG: TIM barrel protein [Firmicutes bacterium]|nr:TIM barrel protein [Bacillota bacterium]